MTNLYNKIKFRSIFLKSYITHSNFFPFKIWDVSKGFGTNECLFTKEIDWFLQIHRNTPIEESQVNLKTSERAQIYSGRDDWEELLKDDEQNITIIIQDCFSERTGAGQYGRIPDDAGTGQHTVYGSGKNLMDRTIRCLVSCKIWVAELFGIRQKLEMPNICWFDLLI